MAEHVATIAVPSRSEAGVSREVTIYRLHRGILVFGCDCPASTFGNVCAHISETQRPFVRLGYRTDRKRLTPKVDR